MLPDKSEREAFACVPWRVGRKVGRTIYAMANDHPTGSDPLIGVMDTRGLAEAVVADHNAALSEDRDA